MSGRIAATLPLPDAPIDFSAASAEKLFVNESTETDGVELALEALVDVDAGGLAAELDVLDELLDELPHAATNTETASMGTNARNLPTMHLSSDRGTLSRRASSFSPTASSREDRLAALHARP